MTCSHVVTLFGHVMTLCVLLYATMIFHLGVLLYQFSGTVRDKLSTQLQRVVAHVLLFEQCLDAVFWPLHILQSGFSG